MKKDAMKYYKFYIVESTNTLVDGKFCLNSEINLNVSIGEENHCYVFREVWSISSMKKTKSKVFNQRKLEIEDLRCDTQAFKNNSVVGE
jgi:hypothetical protein